MQHIILILPNCNRLLILKYIAVGYVCSDPNHLPVWNMSVAKLSVQHCHQMKSTQHCFVFFFYLHPEWQQSWTIQKTKQFPECMECCCFTQFARCGERSFHKSWHPSLHPLWQRFRGKLLVFAGIPVP